MCSESGVRLDAQGWRQVVLSEVSTREIHLGSPGDKRLKLSLQVANVQLYIQVGTISAKYNKILSAQENEGSGEQ